MKIKFFAGKIKSDQMNNEGWLNEWQKSAQEAEKEDCSLVVFKIKNESELKAIESIEKLIEDFK